MSRVGKSPIPVKKGVEITIKDQLVTVKGSKGTLKQEVMEGISIFNKNDHILLTIPEEKEELKAFHGLYRSLINNMVLGVSEGFSKQLELIGVGYRATVKGKALDLQLGFSHPTLVDIPEGIEVKVDKNTKMTIAGADKQAVGQFAARIRAMRPPEPYKGKGVRYKDEYVRKKAGKTGK
jgi:large subunit ribosomal protein L6